MTKGKSKTKAARRDIMRSNAANVGRKDRQKVRSYDKQAYDKPTGEES